MKIDIAVTVTATPSATATFASKEAPALLLGSTSTASMISLASSTPAEGSAPDSACAVHGPKRDALRKLVTRLRAAADRREPEEKVARRRGSRGGGGGGRQPKRAWTVAMSLGGCGGGGGVARVRTRLSAYVLCGAKAGWSLEDDDACKWQIGRASCRERVSFVV